MANTSLGYESSHTGSQIDEAVGAVLGTGGTPLAQRVSTAETGIASLRSDVDSEGSRLNSLEATVGMHSSNISNLQDTATSLDERMTTAEEKIDNLPSDGGGGSVEEEIGIEFPTELFYCKSSVWTASVLDRYTSYVLPAETLREKTVRIDPNTERAEGVRVCFLKSAPVANATLDFCEGESGEIQTTEAFTKTVPADCSYIVFRINDYVSGTIISFSPRLFVQVPMADRVSELMGIRYVADVNLDLSKTILYWINQKNAYANDSRSYGTFIPAETYRGRVLRVEPSATWWGGMRFAFLASLNSTTKPSGSPDYCDSEPCIIQGTSTVLKKVPSDCSYIYIQVSNRENNEAVDCSPSSVSVCDEIGKAVEKVAQTVPQNANGDFATLKAYTTSVYGLTPSLYAKDAAKRMMADNVVPFVLIVGQSNADGRCTTSDAPSWLSGAGYAIEDYKMWNNTTEQFSTFSVTTNNGAGTANGSTSTSNQTYSFDAYFAHAYLARYGGQLYALKHTIGATPIHRMPSTGTVAASWNPDIKSFPSGCRPLLAELVTKLRSARAWAANNGKALFPIAILWHQGETDGDNNDYQYYAQDVVSVFGFLRGCFGTQNIPILTGYLNEQYQTKYSQINGILENLKSQDNYLKVVDMTDHFTGRTGDLVHYNESAISYMGEQMFADYNTLNLGI